jgi:serine/threonine protein kinase
VDDLEFGNALVAKGMLSADELREAMWERQRAQRVGGTAPFLWDILIQKGFLSRVQVDEALAGMQKRSRFCGACNVIVAVPRITPQGERCGKCGGPVTWRSLEAKDAAEPKKDTMVMLGEGVPAEVRIARADPSLVLGKYVLVEEAGHGGAGVVFKAWDLVLGQYVALKLIRKLKEGARLSREDLIKDLLKEARNSIRLRHPNIVPVFDAGRINDEFFICMEFIEGDSLAAHMRAASARDRLSPLYEDPVRYLQLMRDVCSAIHYAHTFPNPIIHCDLKPGNILIEAGGRPYVVDFGLAQPADLPDSALAQMQGHVRGTPAYMSPEQLTGRVEDIGPWTDIYALGTILYELLTGRQVFKGTAYEMLLKVTRDEPVAPLQIIAQSRELGRDDTATLLVYGPKLEALALKCLSKAREKRPQSAMLVADELGKIISGLGQRRAAGTASVSTTATTNVLPPPPEPAIDEQMTRLELEPLVEQIASDASWENGDLASLATDRARQVKCLEAFKDRIIERVNSERPKVPLLELLDRKVQNVELLRANRRMLVLFDQGQSVELYWPAIPPLTFVGLVADVLKMTQDPRDRLALGLYCLTARINDIGLQLLSTLRGTPLEPAAAGLMKGRAG